MNYYLGIDGGGTKTECLLVDETGQVVAHVLTDGCSYKEIGVSDIKRLAFPMQSKKLCTLSAAALMLTTKYLLIKSAEWQ